jgi:hypothetical protein
LDGNEGMVGRKDCLPCFLATASISSVARMRVGCFNVLLYDIIADWILVCTDSVCQDCAER